MVSCLLLFWFYIFHDVVWLAIQNLTQLHDGVNCYTSIMDKAVHGFGIDFIGVPQIYLFDPFFFHFLIQRCVGNRHCNPSFLYQLLYSGGAISSTKKYRKLYKIIVPILVLLPIVFLYQLWYNINVNERGKVDKPPKQTP